MARMRERPSPANSTNRLYCIYSSNRNGYNMQLVKHQQAVQYCIFSRNNIGGYNIELVKQLYSSNREDYNIHLVKHQQAVRRLGKYFTFAPSFP